MFKRLIIALTLAFTSLQGICAESKSIIVISPYAKSDAWSRSTLSPITDLEASHPELQIDYFTLDVAGIFSARDYDTFVGNVVNHEKGRKPDLIVIAGSQTYVVAEDFNRYWPGVKILLTGDTNYICDKEYVLEKYPNKNAIRTPVSAVRPHLNLTLVQSPLYFKETLDMMRTMMPYMQEVIFIGGEDFYSRESQLKMKETVEGAGYKFTGITPRDMSFDSFKSLVANRNKSRTAFLFKSCFCTEPTEFSRESIENILPVFYMHYMLPRGKHGGLGYYTYDFKLYESALQSTISDIIFKKRNPRDIPFTYLPHTSPVVNVECMAAYGFDRRLVPEDANLINVPPTFWEQYKIAIIIIFCLLVLLCFAVHFLGVTNKNKRKIEAMTLELEAANKKLRSARDRAVHLSELKSLYVQNMSHDVRTPINAIVGFSQLLSLPDGLVSEEEKNDYMKYIANNSEMLLMLVDDILNLSDLENNGYKIEMADCNCNSILQSAFSCAESRVKDGVKMYFTSEVGDEFKIHSDPKRIQQILVNFLTNACKHTDKGEIRLHCSISEKPDYVVFSVTDTGHGVDPSMADSIFERYKKLDNVEGHGIGLNICQTLAEKLGSTVRLDTSYKNGARFLLEVPVSKVWIQSL